MCLVMTQFSRSMSLDVIVIRATASLDNLGALLPGINLLKQSAGLQEVPIFILGVTSSASAAASQCDFVHVAAVE